MSMSKKDFIALADVMKSVYQDYDNAQSSSLARNSVPVNLQNVRDKLADFCAKQNPRFMRDRWLAYIAGECGPNGGGVKQPKSWAVQGNYGQGWETVCTEDNRAEALVRLREYRENETEYSHRIVRDIR